MTIGIVKENTNSADDFALINATTENGYAVTIVTIASNCVSQHRQKCLLFLLTSICSDYFDPLPTETKLF